MQKAGAHCPVKRLWISSLTEEAIREGFQNLKDQSDFKPLYEAGLSRAIGDWVLGMNATRLTPQYMDKTDRFYLSVAYRHPPCSDCQKDNWKLRTSLPNSIGYLPLYIVIRPLPPSSEKAMKNWHKRKVTKKESAKKEQEDCKKTEGIPPITDLSTGEALMERIKNVPFTVTEVTKKAGTEAPPRLFDLTSLQVECNKVWIFG